ncbi:MAG TPA: PIN domain-containing protein [Candidatus Manganitrophaceae bacterium]|nr:PIN domain-containing protein [Candidatus Manganitrophaceae bacterium]
MSGKTFVDTNVLLYAYDRDAGAKHLRAKTILEGLWETRNGVVSVQVLQEFYVNVTRKIPKPLPRRDARRLIEQYLAWEVVSVHGPMILAASEVEEKSKLSFWDALIIAAARKGRASLLLSEDFQDGRKFEGMRIQNPFL